MKKRKLEFEIRCDHKMISSLVLLNIIQMSSYLAGLVGRPPESDLVTHQYAFNHFSVFMNIKGGSAHKLRVGS